MGRGNCLLFGGGLHGKWLLPHAHGAAILPVCREEEDVVFTMYGYSTVELHTTMFTQVIITQWSLKSSIGVKRPLGITPFRKKDISREYPCSIPTRKIAPFPNSIASSMMKSRLRRE